MDGSREMMKILRQNAYRQPRTDASLPRGTRHEPSHALDTSVHLDVPVKLLFRQLANVMGSLCAALLLMAPLSARAQGTVNPPGKVAYQGFLTDENGVPIGNSSPVNLAVIFRIFTAATGGTPKWAEQQTVTVDKGHYSVLLGEGRQNNSEPHTADLTSIFAGGDASERLIEITLGETRILPRVQFFPVPYSMLAMNARQFLDENGNTILKNVAGKVNITGGVGVSGDVTAQKYSGAGGGLIGLNASTLATGTVPDARLSPNLLGGITIAQGFKNLGEVAYAKLNVVERMTAGSIQSPFASAQGVTIGTNISTGSALEVFGTVSMFNKPVKIYEGRVDPSWLTPNTWKTEYPITDTAYTVALKGYYGNNYWETVELSAQYILDNQAAGGSVVRNITQQGSSAQQEDIVTVLVPKGSEFKIVLTANNPNTASLVEVKVYRTAFGK